MRAGLLSAIFLAVTACGSGGGGSDGGGDAGVQPAFTPTFANVNSKIFMVSCSLSACHSPPAGPFVGNLDLKTNPYAALLGDGGVPASDPTSFPYHYNGMPLVTPGDPAHSLLFQKLASTGPTGCSQTPTGSCEYGQHMPNVPGETLGVPYVEAVREWIANGAPND